MHKDVSKSFSYEELHDKQRETTIWLRQLHKDR